MQNKFCLSKIGMARKYCISLEKENYNDIGTPLEFRQENNIRITTLLQRWCQVGKPTSKTQRCNNVIFSSYYLQRKHNVVTMLWQRYPMSQPKYNQNLPLLQRCVPTGILAQKKWLWHTFVPVNFVKLLRTFLQNMSGRLLKQTIYLKIRIFIQLIIIM